MGGERWTEEGRRGQRKEREKEGACVRGDVGLEGGVARGGGDAGGIVSRRTRQGTHPSVEVRCGVEGRCMCIAVMKSKGPVKGSPKAARKGRNRVWKVRAWLRRAWRGPNGVLGAVRGVERSCTLVGGQRRFASKVELNGSEVRMRGGHSDRGARGSWGAKGEGGVAAGKRRKANRRVSDRSSRRRGVARKEGLDANGIVSEGEREREREGSRRK